MVSILGGALTDEETFKEPRRRPGPWRAAIGVGGALLLVGLILWAPRAGGKLGDADSDLGAALLGGAVIAFAVLFLQWRFEIRAQELQDDAAQAQHERDTAAASAQRRRDEEAADTRRRQDDRQHAQILTALRRDLTGIDLRGRDLSGFYLRRRILERAKLDGVTLDGANLALSSLEGATLSHAKLRGSAYLTATYMRGADLENAELQDAYLAGADLRGATLVLADLARADFSDADLRGCDLREARNLGAATFAGARYDTETQWPDSQPPDGVIEIDPDDAWKSEAAIAQAK